MRPGSAFCLVTVLALIASCAARDDTNTSSAADASAATALGAGGLEYPILVRSTQLARQVKKASGLAEPSSFGMWTERRVIAFQLERPLPRDFTLTLHAGSYGPNMEKPAIIRAGTVERELLIDAPYNDPREFSVDFAGVEDAETLLIEIPAPTSPRSLGQGADGRALGYVLVEASIRPR